ncbi:RDD family protein [Luteimonas abyssi]|uniref:RDD family protein n=1 Tax=Luteimonas abyssi TaxID=1247514 RepID=UPI000737D5A0|nr:RDD family protein [Luteimonas abyssi]
MQQEAFEYVGFWARVGAAAIDTIIAMIVTTPLLLWIYGTGYFTDIEGPLVAGPADVLITWVLPTVAVILFWLRKQATPGKMVIAARVVDAKTGGPISVGQAIGRYLAYIPAMLPLCLGLIWVAFDPRKQGWHDKMAGTLVVRPQREGAAPVRFGS